MTNEPADNVKNGRKLRSSDSTAPADRTPDVDQPTDISASPIARPGIQRVSGTSANAITESADADAVGHGTNFGREESDITSLLPASFGRYRVEKQLGRGGFGVVYQGWDEQLRRPVAIKVTHCPSSAVQQLNDALQEAQTIAGLDHPHIVPVFDVGQTPDGKCYVVSKLIDGQNLSELMNSRKVSRIEASRIVVAIAEALHFAHMRGLVHRDVKPANILIDSQGCAFLTDFGISLREENLGKGAEFAGTPHYMSPEQARGNSHRLDGRSDIYSLGVVLYELLTTRRPFQPLSAPEILPLIATTDVRPPRQLDDTIPIELERICLKSLSRPTSERYSTAGDMAEDLRRWLAANDSTTGDDRPWRRNREFRFGTSFRNMGCSVALVFGILAMATVGQWRFGTGQSRIGQVVNTVPREGQPQPEIDVMIPGPVFPSVPGDMSKEPVEEESCIVRFDILVSRNKDTFRPLTEMAPLITGDHIRFSIQLNDHRYVRLVWIDAAGNPGELFPNDPEVGDRGSEPVAVLESPMAVDRGWPLDGESGTETAVLLISKTPLTDITISKMTPKSITEQPSISEYRASRTRAVEFTQHGEMADATAPEKQDPIFPDRSLGHQSEQIDDPVLSLIEQLRQQCDEIRAISVQHRAQP